MPNAKDIFSELSRMDGRSFTGTFFEMLFSDESEDEIRETLEDACRLNLSQHIVPRHELDVIYAFHMKYGKRFHEFSPELREAIEQGDYHLALELMGRLLKVEADELYYKEHPLPTLAPEPKKTLEAPAPTPKPVKKPWAMPEMEPTFKPKSEE